MTPAMPLHPIVLPDGRVPCDRCDAAIETAEAEANFQRCEQMACDACAEEFLEANPPVEVTR